jgi:hypothetical protein
MRNNYWVVICENDNGWGEVYDGLWGYDERVYRTKKEARDHARYLRATGDWNGETPPVYGVALMDVNDIYDDDHLRDELIDILTTEYSQDYIWDRIKECEI